MDNDTINALLANTPMSTNIEDRRKNFSENTRVRNAFKESLLNPEPQNNEVILGPDDNIENILSALMKATKGK